MGSHETSGWRMGAIILALTACAGALGQTCMIPAPADHELHPVWGGESWATYSEVVGADLRIWTGEDGGRIRTSFDGGATWDFADTPDDYTGSVFDIWFFPGGVHGFATGRGGRVLETIDGGLTWTYFGAQVIDAAGDPATLWGVRSLGNGVVIVSGLWIFAFTSGAATPWTPIDVYDRNPAAPGAQVITHDKLELFRLDVVGPLGSFVGCVGGEWEEDAGGHGVVLFTDAALTEASLGRKWWLVLDDGATPIPPSGAVMLQPWSLRFERGSTSTTSSVGYVIGGRGGNKASRWYRSVNSGRTWTLDGEGPVTMYDVTSDPSGRAMIVGYSGNYWTRDPGTGTWSGFTMPSPSTWFPSPGFSTGALLAATGFGASGLIAVGDFGSQRISTDYGQSWNSMSPFYPTSEELEQRIYDCCFLPSAPLTGLVVGQSSRILRTTDGGCSWADTQLTLGATLFAIDADDMNRAVAVGNSGLIYYSANGGVSWRKGKFPPATLFPYGHAFRDVALTGTGEVWAVGTSQSDIPVVAYSANGGKDWVLATPPTSGNLGLYGVAFANPAEGLVVGESYGSGSTKTARAFVASINAGTLTWVDISPTLPGASTSLADVALSGSSLATAIAFAVGRNGLVLEWTGTGFVTPVFPGANPPLAIDLRVVDVSPTGGTVLIGGAYGTELSNADDKGFLIRRDASGWSTLRAVNGKDTEGISLTSDTEGYLAGQTGGGSASFINGNLASSVLLRYLAN